MSTLRSMTGFGRAQGANERLGVSVTVRAVNHKNLDLVLRLPDELRPAEAGLRDLLRQKLRRGRVEARIDVEYLAERPTRVEVSHETVEQLRRTAARLAEEGLAGGELSVADLLRMPEVVRVKTLDHEWSDGDGVLVEQVLTRARDEALAARRREGDRLHEVLVGLAGQLESAVAAVRERRPEALDRMREVFRERVAVWLGDVSISEERLAQEIALLLERADVQEELDRLDSHLASLVAQLDQDGPVGRQLDFLAQEILRELNTLGAKLRDLPVIQTVLEARAVAEQIREQLQNVE